MREKRRASERQSKIDTARQKQSNITQSKTEIARRAQSKTDTEQYRRSNTGTEQDKTYKQAQWSVNKQSLWSVLFCSVPSAVSREGESGVEESDCGEGVVEVRDELRVAGVHLRADLGTLEAADVRAR